jgi:hypothetical protein
LYSESVGRRRYPVLSIDVSGLEKGLHIVEITDVASNKINTRLVITIPLVRVGYTLLLNIKLATYPNNLKQA